MKNSNLNKVKSEHVVFLLLGLLNIYVLDSFRCNRVYCTLFQALEAVITLFLTLTTGPGTIHKSYLKYLNFVIYDFLEKYFCGEGGRGVFSVEFRRWTENGNVLPGLMIKIMQIDFGIDIPPLEEKYPNLTVCYTDLRFIQEKSMFLKTLRVHSKK